MRVQPTEVNWFAGVLAVAIGAVVEAGQRLFDLVQQRVGALAVDNAEFAVGSRARLICLIAFTDRIRGRGRVQLTLRIRTKSKQSPPEIFHLRRFHERFCG